jgi:4-aminobutyrate aminotransferase-like enzyme
MAAQAFGVRGVPIPLDSERDQNLRLRSEKRDFLLKISNSADGPAVLDMQNRAMLHIARVDPDLPVTRPLETISGASYHVVEDATGTKHCIRLLTFVPGATVASSELSLDDISAFGTVVARMGIALRGFFHPAAGYRILWDIKNASDLRPLTKSIGEERRAGLVGRTLDRFERLVLPELPSLRAQPIHNDLTLDNVLLDGNHRVSGIVDFGDLTHSAVVCDLAVSLVSLMWGRNDFMDAARAAVHGYRSVTELDGPELRLIGDLVRARLAALVTIGHWRVLRYPDNASYIMANVDLAWDLLESLDGIALDFERPRPLKQDLLRRRRAVLGPALSPLTYDDPLYLVRGEGACMYDEAGRAYLDAYNNVPVVGHSNPAVARAIAQQSTTLNTNTRYLHDAVVELGERLVNTLPEGLDTVIFVNSGSEATDIAWRLATAATDATGALVTRHAYHGVTTAAFALSPEDWVAGQEPGHVTRLRPPQPYERHGRPIEPAAAQAPDIDEALAALDRRDHRLAAFYVDPMFTSDGILSPPATYLQEITRRVHEVGGLVVADEVQAGYGRTGTRMWSFQMGGITPDLVTLGKPMGNGHPIAAIITRREIVERFAEDNDLFSTFGGNPVAARAALAVIDELERLDLMRNAADVGAHLASRLRALKALHQPIADVRGEGLMIGVELRAAGSTRDTDSTLTHRVMNSMKDRGVLVGATGPHGNVLKIRPPLVLSRSQAERIVEVLDESLRENRSRQ